MSQIGLLGRGFGVVALTPPTAPTLAVTDDGDGEGATATISGGDAGATHAVYVSIDGDSWELGGTRVGNGAVALTVRPGACLAYAIATGPGGSNISNVVAFGIADPDAAAGESVHEVFFEQQVEVVADWFADAAVVTYTDPNGTPYIVDAIVGDETRLERTNTAGFQEVVARRSVRIKESELAWNVVKRRGTVTVNSVEYGIVGKLEPFAGEYVLELEAIEPAELTRRNYRR